jgi:hypothetical protein
MADMISNIDVGGGAGVEEVGKPGKSTEPTSPEELLEELQKDLDRLKAQKARPTGGVEGSTLEALCFVNDEHYVSYKNKTLALEPRDDNKLYLSFNLITPRYQKLMGRLSAFNAGFKARPNRRDPQALEEAEIVDRMNIALDEKLDEPSRLRERIHWLLTGGTVFEFVPWLPNATIEPMAQFGEDGSVLYKDLSGQNPNPMSEADVQAAVSSGIPPESFEPWEEVQTTGEVGSIILSPFNVFIDASVRSIADLAPDQWVHIAEIKTVGWIEENYPDEVDSIEPMSEINLVSSKIQPDSGDATGGTYLKDLIPIVQGSTDSNDPKMLLHIQSFQPASTKYPKGRYVCWVPKQKILHEDENPYEEIPLVDFHFKPVTTTFWTKGYITGLIQPQRFINRRMSQLGEQANATLYSSILLGAGLTAADIPADYPGVVQNGWNEAGGPNLGRMPPPEIPNWFLQSINTAVQMFNEAAGGADLMDHGQFPGQLRGPMAVPMLQEILDTQWGPLFNHLGERLARVKQMRLNRVKQFYPPLRTMHYTDKEQKDEVINFHAEKILRSGTNFNVTVERGSILPELRALREARLTERLSGPLMVLYIDERTGRLDKSKIAADLQFGDVGREARESQYRKLALEINKMLWEGKTPPPVQPFYDHKGMIDELEHAMATTEFLKASPQIQQLFSDRWNQHATFLQQEAMNQQMAMNSHMVQNAVAQATQQSAAMAAADAVHSAMGQVHAQNEQPTDQFVQNAQQQSGGNFPQRPGMAQRPAPGQGGSPNTKPNTLKRKTTIEEHGE